MIRIKKNKPLISPDTKTFREIRRFHLNRTYMPIKIGLVAAYIILGMLSASTSMCGILIGAMIRIAGFDIIFFIFLFLHRIERYQMYPLLNFLIAGISVSISVKLLNHQKFHDYRKSHTKKFFKKRRPGNPPKNHQSTITVPCISG